MKVPIRISSMTAIALFACASLLAAPVSHTERFVRDFPLDAGGTLWIEDPIGAVDVVGSDQDGVSVSVVKVVVAPEGTSLKEGREQTQVLMGGDAKSRLIRTVVNGSPAAKWKSNVAYVVRVPRATTVHITGQMGEHIKVTNIAGTVTAKNTNGEITLDSIDGPVTVDSVNGNIHFLTEARPSDPVQLTTVNGSIEVQVNGDSNLDWIAQSITGDFKTNLALRSPRIALNTMRGIVNGPGGPSLVTTAVMGDVFLLSRGGSPNEIRSVKMAVVRPAVPGPQATPVASLGVLQQQARVIETIEQPLVNGPFMYATKLGNFRIGEIRGLASIQTGAGQVYLGTVTGNCSVRSMGGPLELGDIYGDLNAHTEAGEILVRNARKGGELSTGGGTLHVIYAGGAISLHNGGGDIIVNQAVGAVEADTRSGDVMVTMDPRLHTQHVSVKTTKGNIVLNIGGRFAADIDATILTTDEEAAGVRSDFNGLTIKRDTFNGKTRVRATGKIGGGGEKIELYTEDGEIQITQQGVTH
ncbi:MAG TPA: hypothetical protein VJ901_22320 [Thermoanaerobaculia bacterium]|nr:hypothetical protein [Thermoanaerobaculia bacterium]